MLDARPSNRTFATIIFFLCLSLVIVIISFDLIEIKSFFAIKERSFDRNDYDERFSTFPPLTRNVAITVAFNHEVDPQRGNKVATKDPFSYIQSWYESIVKHEHMNGVVLSNIFDNTTLETVFASRPRSDRIKFVFMDPYTHVAFQNISDYKINDQSYFITHWWLKQNQHEYDYAMLTDAHDVTFLHDPFSFMRSVDSTMEAPQVYAGEEHPPNGAAFGWLEPLYKSCMGRTLEKSRRGKFYNSGILGAETQLMLRFLEQMIDLWNTQVVCASCRCNMVVFGIVLQDEYKDNVISGWPLHTKFTKWESVDSHAFIRHK